MKKIIFSLLAITLSFSAIADAKAETKTVRSWTYLGLSYSFNKNWSFTVMPGHKYEWHRVDGKEIDTFLYELFVGPSYSTSFGNFHLKFPVWYYYLGFPYKPTDDYHSNHNLAVLPTLSYRLGDLSLSGRLFAHNTFYSGFYDSRKEQWGYSLLLTEMLSIAYRVYGTVHIMTALELFTGVIEDQETEATSGAGFYRKGFTKSKFYTGFYFFPMKKVYVKINYILEDSFSKSGKNTQTDHFIYLVLTHKLN